MNNVDISIYSAILHKDGLVIYASWSCHVTYGYVNVPCHMISHCIGKIF